MCPKISWSEILEVGRRFYTVWYIALYSAKQPATILWPDGHIVAPVVASAQLYFKYMINVDIIKVFISTLGPFILYAHQKKMLESTVCV